MYEQFTIAYTEVSNREIGNCTTYVVLTFRRLCVIIKMSRCLYVNCESNEITSSQRHVEIKTVLPRSGVKKMKSVIKSKMLIFWKSNGEAMLHRHCYDLLLKSARARNPKGLIPKMLQEEKALFKEAIKTAEYFDSIETLRNEGMKVAEMIKKSKHCVVFTGAGISTSAGIGDYRGKSGKWTQQDQASINMDSVFASGSREKINEEMQESTEEEDDDGGVPYECLRPTYTHEALQKLIANGYVKHIISQNGDGLHGLSGVCAADLSELHGNVFVEICETCKTRYDRPFYVMDDACSLYFEELEDHGKSSVKKPTHAKKCDRCGLSHRTGRRCEKKGCKGFLMDSIINFRDLLEDDILEQATWNAQHSDLMICLGSTLTVTPANSLVEMTKEPQQIVICNRQTTDIDDLCMRACGPHGEVVGSRVFGDCDIFMQEIMKHILVPEDLKSWEDGREKRMENYNSCRVPVV
ncbi:NAD-dependent protein deacetylase Sirt6-like [Gigantopelta aegis]|uniref:NAD-dependent protein deacetylase Sirt6-like n=1 Tax=Gigantopelta aegis TaxID=1735272 RepID=UPI001B88CA51|nr:NAD-dependent protein deacetylase Sirt6-like [Gigantopelta aegis]